MAHKTKKIKVPILKGRWVGELGTLINHNVMEGVVWGRGGEASQCAAYYISHAQCRLYALCRGPVKTVLTGKGITTPLTDLAQNNYMYTSDISRQQ